MLVELPFTFVNNTPADADEVNANFSTVVNALNSHLQEINPHGVTPQQIGAETPTGAQQKATDALNAAKTYAKTYTDQQVATRAAIKHSHGADDLPKASTTAQGIVQLTTSRTSSSNTLALAASAMNAHRTSSDHDDRYYTKAQVDALIGGSVGMVWMVPDLETTFASVTPKTGSVWETTDDWEGIASFTVTFPGTYLIYGTMRARVNDEPGSVAVCVPGWTHRELIPGNVTLSDVPPPGLGWASPIFATSSTSTDVSFYLEMYVPAPPGGAIIVVARQSRVNHVSINGHPGSAPPARAWSRKN